MSIRFLRPFPVLPLLAVAAGVCSPVLAESGAPADDAHAWAVHDPDRPLPPRVDPGPASERPAPIPSDAVVLFDGTAPGADLSAWSASGAAWVVGDGSFAVPPGSGDLATVRGFGDVQLHVEWMTPTPPGGDPGRGQARGNSGVFLMDRYEVQILESADGGTYADGMAGAVYGQSPPTVNAGRGLDAWQAFDLFFRAPRFGADGGLLAPATVTVLHNGVLVQDHWTLEGPTRHRERTSYGAHAPEAPLRLQNHGQLVRFRNVWARPLPPRPVSPAGG